MWNECISSHSFSGTSYLYGLARLYKKCKLAHWSHWSNIASYSYGLVHTTDEQIKLLNLQFMVSQATTYP
jgi:hypothetical protein